MVGSQHPVVATGDLRFERVHDGFLDFLFLRCEAMLRRYCLFRLFGCLLRHSRFALFSRCLFLSSADDSLPDKLFGEKADQPRIYTVNNELSCMIRAGIHALCPFLALPIIHFVRIKKSPNKKIESTQTGTPFNLFFSNTDRKQAEACSRR